MFFLSSGYNNNKTNKCLKKINTSLKKFKVITIYIKTIFLKLKA